MIKKKKINLITFRLKKKIFNKLKTSKNNYFVGDWCNSEKNYLIKNNKKSLNFYKVNNIKGKLNDTNKIDKLYKSLLIKFTQNLNMFHKKKLPIKCWEIIIGRWLYTYVLDVFARWAIISDIKKKYNIDKFYKLETSGIDFIPLNTINYRMMVREHNQFYSHFIFSKISEYLDDKQEKKIVNFKKDEIRQELNSSRDHEYFYGVIAKHLRFSCFFYKCSFDKKIFLNFFKEFKFINIPLKKKKISLNTDFDLDKRKRFFEKLKIKRKKSNLEDFLIKLSFYTFPKSFIENFNEISRISNNINWPSKPKFILTSYGHYNDEFFKFYCAQKISKGAKLLIFQHGAGGIFANKEFYGQRYDLNIANKFLSWGKNKKENSKPFFYNKKISKNSDYSFCFKKKILVILYQLNESVVFPPNGYLSRDEINRKTFYNFRYLVKNTKKNIAKNFQVRILDGSLKENYKPFRKSINMVFPKITFSNNNLSYNNILKNYNLVFHFRVSTAFFESIFQNTPSILILDKNVNMGFDKKFGKFINMMIKKNMAFSNLKSASSFLNKRYFDINQWWNSKDLKKLRFSLNENYCRNFDNKKKDFKNLFQF